MAGSAMFVQIAKNNRKIFNLDNEIDIKKDISHDLIIDWHSQDNLWWDETCTSVIEVFGLPGHRYTYVPNLDNMIFKFKSEKDFILCKMLLSEKL